MFGVARVDSYVQHVFECVQCRSFVKSLPIVSVKDIDVGFDAAGCVLNCLASRCHIYLSVFRGGNREDIVAHRTVGEVLFDSQRALLVVLIAQQALIFVSQPYILTVNYRIAHVQVGIVKRIPLIAQVKELMSRTHIVAVIEIDTSVSNQGKHIVLQSQVADILVVECGSPVCSVKDVYGAVGRAFGSSADKQLRWVNLQKEVDVVVSFSGIGNVAHALPRLARRQGIAVFGSVQKPLGSCRKDCSVVDCHCIDCHLCTVCSYVVGVVNLSSHKVQDHYSEAARKISLAGVETDVVYRLATLNASHLYVRYVVHLVVLNNVDIGVVVGDDCRFCFGVVCCYLYSGIRKPVYFREPFA